MLLLEFLCKKSFHFAPDIAFARQQLAFHYLQIIWCIVIYLVIKHGIHQKMAIVDKAANAVQVTICQAVFLGITLHEFSQE